MPIKLSFLFAGLLPGPLTDPVAIFLTILAIMLVAPLLFERIQLPGIVGLILAGVVVGPHGLGVLDRGSNIILLGTVGLLFLMFMAGLETSLDDFKANGDKSSVFGLATFAVPMVVGTAAMLLLGYGWLAAILVASCFASHTLLALPILSKLGIMRTPAVMTTLGGTLITNTLALLVLAVVVKAKAGGLTLGFWLFLIPALILYTLLTLWGVPILGKWFFKRFGHDDSAEFIFVLATLFVVSYMAGVIEIEPIIGAFLAGTALTPLIPQLSPLMNRIQFIGNTLFVPFFLISVGMLIDPLILIRQPKSLVVAVVMIGAELLSKFIAAWVSGKVFGFRFPSIMVMFGLSAAQAASTLAAITVAYNIKLVDQATVNGIVAMILVTCVASPWITERWGKGVALEDPHPSTATHRIETLAQRVLVPVANPRTEDNLLTLALILAQSVRGTLLPLHVLSDHAGPVTLEQRQQQRRLLDLAETVAHAANTEVQTIGRVDDAIDRGIVRSAIENNASLIVCGWKGTSTYQENFFGGVIDNVASRSAVPVLFTRLIQPIANTVRVLLMVTKRQIVATDFRITLAIAKTLATELKASLQVMVVINSKQTKLSSVEIGKLSPDIPVGQIQGKFVREISNRLQNDDLLILSVSSQLKRFPRASVVGTAPVAIAHAHPEASILITHFPHQSS